MPCIETNYIPEEEQVEEEWALPEGDEFLIFISKLAAELRSPAKCLVGWGPETEEKTCNEIADYILRRRVTVRNVLKRTFTHEEILSFSWFTDPWNKYASCRSYGVYRDGDGVLTGKGVRITFSTKAIFE